MKPFERAKHDHKSRSVKDIDLPLTPSHRLKKTYRDEDVQKTIRKGTYAWIGVFMVHFIYKNGEEMEVPDGYSAKKLRYSIKEFEPLKKWFKKI
jgi:hypothetical protein